MSQLMKQWMHMILYKPYRKFRFKHILLLPAKNEVLLTATQKKNLKRSQKRQEKREADGDAEQPQITDEERLAAIAQQYAVLNNRTSASFVDFVSILNQYCQKSRINVPKYTEAAGVLGGFGAQVFVKGQVFTNMKYCGTKKEARHDAAKVALLGLNIPVETELDESRKKRQEEWEKVRKEDDPLECPEQVHDNKTLYERLQEQKQKKQDEWDEQHQLKNMIRGLDSDETVFLDMVSKQQEEIANRRFSEESQEIKEYRDAVSQFQSTACVPTDIKPPGSAVSNRKSSQESGTKKSQFQLIAGAIKRKSNTEKTSQEKKFKVCEDIEKNHNVISTKEWDAIQEKTTSKEPNTSLGEGKLMEQSLPNRTEKEPEHSQVKQDKPVIPGLAVYSDSSDSETSSSDSCDE